MIEGETSWLQTPNARLIYKKLDPKVQTDELLANSINDLVELEQIVMEETRFQWANSSIYIYFFEKKPIWVAREVIGLPNEDPLDRFGLQDLASLSCLQGTLKPGPFELGALQLEEDYMLLCSVFEKESSKPLAKCWRIKLERERISSELQIQLFPE